MNWLRRGLKQEEGISLILTSMALVGLMAISAFVIDIGNANQRGRANQSTADASAIAGGWDLLAPATARTTAADYVADNLDLSLGTEVTCPTDPNITSDTVCYETSDSTIWITTPWDSNDYLLRVEICQDVETSFAKVIGFNTLNVCRHAISEVEPPTPGSPGGPAIQSFSPTEKAAFETSGNASIWTNGDIFIGSCSDGDAFVAAGDGGVEVEGDVWYYYGDCDGDGNAEGGCAKPPNCDNTEPGVGFSPGSLPMPCDPAGLEPSVPVCPGGTTHFEDVHLNHPIRSIDFTDLAACLDGNFAGAGCSIYDPGVSSGYPAHAERVGTQTNSVADLGISYNNSDPLNPRCVDSADNDVPTSSWAQMSPGRYSNSGAYKIIGCVVMAPGIYLFDGGFTVDPAYLQANDVLIINGAPGTVAKVSKSSVCLTGITSGAFENFLYYQNPANDSLFVVTSDSFLFLAGIVYNPSGGIEINGATTAAPWSIGGDGATTGCLGQVTSLGGSIIGTTVKVKSDGQLSINALEGGAAAGGGGWVRLFE